MTFRDFCREFRLASRENPGRAARVLLLLAVLVLCALGLMAEVGYLLATFLRH